MAHNPPPNISPADYNFLRQIGERYEANPFRFDVEGKRGRNLSAISRAVKVDPDYARQLCTAAGDRWEDWAPPEENR